MIYSSLDVHDLLGARGDFSSDAKHIPWRKIVMLMGLCGGLHGIAMGSHAGSFLQLILSAIKIPFLIAISTSICIPSLFAMATISGLRDDFPARVQVGMQGRLVPDARARRCDPD